jgi:Cu(I)/Ag(I) efflux system membrane fusion protein
MTIEDKTEQSAPLPEGDEVAPAGVRSMAVVRWAIVVVMALVAAVAILNHLGVSFGRRATGDAAQTYYCPMHPQIVQDHPGECPICSMTLVLRPPGPVRTSATMQPKTTAAEVTYECPMHPQVTSHDANATCHLCGMNLEPRPAQAHAGVPGLVPVELSADRVQLIGVRTAVVATASVGGGLRTVGAVAANERGLAQISPRFSGWIERLLVDETGTRVARGQVVATIYSPELLQAQQELLSALGWASAGPGRSPRHQGPAEATTDLIADAQHRLELLGISKEEVAAITRDKRPRRAIELRSPVEGHVIVKNAVTGMAVQPGAALFEIADLATVWVVADVFESDVARVRVGQTARFEAASFPGEVFSGKLTFVHPSVEASTRTLRVRLELRNRPGPGGLKLRPGMFGNVTLDLPSTEGLAVPAEAVVDTGDSQYVFVDKGGGRYEPRLVKVSARAADRVVIAEGLAAGETVVTTANFFIDSESRLRAAMGTIEGN